jgi:hypothetical protein
MSAYAIALFVHIVGALGFGVALGLEWTGLRQLRNAASPNNVQAWMRILQRAVGVGFISMLATVVTGIYLMVTAWGAVPWLSVTVVALGMLIGLSVVVTRPRMRAIGRALAAGHGPMSPTFRGLVNHLLLWVSIQTRAAVTLGIILLKVAKPDLAGSLLIVGVALVLGIASALPTLRREPAQAGAAD